MKKILLIVAILLLVACSGTSDKVQKPSPIKLGDDEIGYYMQMIVADHAGPKAQLWLSDQRKPLWFVDVRDAILFKRTPEEADNITAIYAHDMAKNPDYHNVKDVWVDIENAFFVIESARKGGMGMPETIPFSDLASAEKFATEHGGQVINSMAEITTEYLTKMPDMSNTDPSQFMQGHQH
jgi:copper chaperone NosL